MYGNSGKFVRMLGHKLEGGHLGDPMHRWENNIKVDLRGAI